jgi:glycerol uptake operon antiterminator
MLKSGTCMNILVKGIREKEAIATPINNFHQLLHGNRRIMAVKSMETLEHGITGNSKILFILFGDIITIPEIVSKIKAMERFAFVHLDLIDGLAPREVVIDFLVKNTKLDGILSTKINLIKHAKACGLLTIHRFFVFDSLSLLNIKKQLQPDYADAIEILPGVIPKIIRKIVKMTNKPIIAGGLILEEEDIQQALDAGATAISTSQFNLI